MKNEKKALNLLEVFVFRSLQNATNRVLRFRKKEPYPVLQQEFFSTPRALADFEDLESAVVEAVRRDLRLHRQRAARLRKKEAAK